jgi:hypothetical protein
VLPAGRRDDLPPLPAVAYLVDEAARAARPAEQSAGGNFYQRTLRIIELFERVAERNRGSQTVSG